MPVYLPAGSHGFLQVSIHCQIHISIFATKQKESSCFVNDLWEITTNQSKGITSHPFTAQSHPNASGFRRRGFYGLHSQRNICPRLSTKFSICHLTKPDRRNITAYKTYTTLLSISWTLLTWPNSWHLATQLQKVCRINAQPSHPHVHCVWNKVGSASLGSWPNAL